jgi:hypothetical protein
VHHVRGDAELSWRRERRPDRHPLKPQHHRRGQSENFPDNELGSRELTLRSNQPGPVMIRLASQGGADHVADLAAIEPERSWRLTVKPAAGTLPGRFTPSGPNGTFRIEVGLRAEALRANSLDGTVSIDTDDPTFPRLTIRVRGRVLDR